MEIKDLSISNDIINLFDYTHNEAARSCLKTMFLTPLSSEQNIIERQYILKGFIDSIDIFQNYPYSRIDFREVDFFIEKFNEKVYLPKRKFKLAIYKTMYYEFKSKCIQFILLYNRLHNYIKNLSTSVFPDKYKKELRFMDEYLNSYRLDYYEGLIREDKLKIKHIDNYRIQNRLYSI